MQNTTGRPATGEDFFPREGDIEKIYQALAGKNNIYLSAPRRVGKTSIMQHLEANPRKGYVFIYGDYEDCESRDEFFQRIFTRIIKSEASLPLIKKLKAKAQKWFEKNIGKLILLELGGKDSQVKAKIQASEIDWGQKCFEMLESLHDQQNRLVLLIDEFPQVVENILGDSGAGLDTARQFLLNNRALRQSPSLDGKVSFVFTGSINIHNTVKKIGDLKLINDLSPISLDPLTASEAEDMAGRILESHGRMFSGDAGEYLVGKIDWKIPFHVQLLLKGIISLPTPNGKTVGRAEVDQGFEQIFDAGNRPYFDHYYSRLPRAYKDDELRFVLALLSLLSKEPHGTTDQARDLARKHQCQERCFDILEALTADGYIHETRHLNRIHFRSMILKEWWARHEYRKHL